MNRETIKLIAVITMLINHIGYLFFQPPVKDVLMAIGYFACITMCWFLVEGYHYTRSKKSYASRLLLFALISQIPFALVGSLGKTAVVHELNVIFNLFFCFLIIHVQETVVNPGRRRICTVLLMAACLFCDWDIMAPVFVLFFVWAGRDREKQVKAWIRSVFLWGIIYYLSKMAELTELSDNAGMKPGTGFFPDIPLNFLLPMTGPALAAVCILCFYNGKTTQHYKGFFKWFFYLFYPIHLLILGLLKMWGCGP